MHLAEGMLSGPVLGATWALAAGGLAVALRRARTGLAEREVPLLGLCAAFVFAAQMLNYKVGPGVSGHFMGGALVAIVLGPSGALIALSVVLLLQCLGWMDGGLGTLGANILNMGGIGGVVAWLCWRSSMPLIRRRRALAVPVAAVAAWLSVMAAAVACALQVGLSGLYPLGPTVAVVGGAHVVIGVGEAIITAGVVSVLLASRPDLLFGEGAHGTIMLPRPVESEGEVRHGS